MDLDLLSKLVDAKEHMVGVKLELKDIENDQKALDKRRTELLQLLRDLEDTLNQYEIVERT